MWDFPSPGLEPVSPALAGRFLTTAPPGKPLYIKYFKFYFVIVGWLTRSLIQYTFLGCLLSTRQWTEHYENCKNVYDTITDLMKCTISWYTNNYNSRQNVTDASRAVSTVLQDISKGVCCNCLLVSATTGTLYTSLSWLLYFSAAWVKWWTAASPPSQETLQDQQVSGRLGNITQGFYILFWEREAVQQTTIQEQDITGRI